MIKKDSDLSRLKNMLTQNKFGANDKFESLFYTDLRGVLADYFDMSGEPLVSIEKRSGGYSVNVSFNADSIKKINSLTD